ncbi:MAG TPA: glycosyltransferase family 1 protein [Gammaproteobacteria bacterium]|nr:glycosyltransferase family 1 protein [Gammaproteobacteria bacterium]
MKTILFLSKGEASVSTRYRAIGYFPFLKQHGWTPQHLRLSRSLHGKIALLRAAEKAAVVVVLRHGLSFPFLQLLRRAARKLIFDFDDAIFLASDGKPSAVRMRRFMRTVVLADGILAGNRYLAEKARQVNPHTVLLPTSVDIDRYAGTTTKAGEFVDLVWIGSRSTYKYLHSILPILEQMSHAEPQLRLKVIADITISSSHLPVLSLPWQEASEVTALQSANIGIAPMYDDPWTRGKCALKVLQYMASHLPVISSPVGANAEIIQNGQTGYLATTSQEWQSAITTLLASPSLREQMGQSGYTLCKERYSQRSCASTLMSALDAW